MDAAPAPAKKTTHVATAAEANCLRGNGGACTLATAKNEIVEVGGPPITTPKLALEAHEMVVAHAWDSEGRLAVASRRRVLYHNQTYKPVGEVKDLAFDARDRLRLGTFAGVENVEDEAIGWPGRCCVCVATIGEDVFAAALDGELAFLKSARDLAWAAPLPADRAQCLAASNELVVVSTRLGSVVAFNHSGSERWSQKLHEDDDGGGTYTIICGGVCYAAGGGAWAAFSLETGAPLIQGILRPRRCRGLGAAASNVIAAVEAGDSEDAPGRRGEMERTCALATLALPRRPAADASKLAKLEARFAVAADPFRAAVRPADGAARLAKLAARLGPPPGFGGAAPPPSPPPGLGDDAPTPPASARRAASSPS
jgi:hypothetical protein